MALNKLIFLSALLCMSFSCISQTKQLDLGDKVPTFTLPTQDGKTFSMKDSVGTKAIVIFFYPKDDNFLCEKELCTYSDSIASFNKANALVIGISENPIEKLKKFHDEHNLKYNLLCDSTRSVLNAFGVKEHFFSDRVTYVVNIAGEIGFKGYSLANGKKHAEEALSYLRQMNSK